MTQPTKNRILWVVQIGEKVSTLEVYDRIHDKYRDCPTPGQVGHNMARMKDRFKLLSSDMVFHNGRQGRRVIYRRVA